MLEREQVLALYETLFGFESLGVNEEGDEVERPLSPQFRACIQVLANVSDVPTSRLVRYMQFDDPPKWVAGHREKVLAVANVLADIAVDLTAIANHKGG